MSLNSDDFMISYVYFKYWYMHVLTQANFQSRIITSIAYKYNAKIFFGLDQPDIFSLTVS